MLICFMKKIIFIAFLLIGVSANAATVFNVVNANDTTTQGQSIDIYINASYSVASDTGRVYIKNIASGNFIQIYKFKIQSFLLIPTQPDGSIKITVLIPFTSEAGPSQIFGNYSNPVRKSIFVRSFVNDVKFVNIGQMSGNAGYSSHIKIGWTFQQSQSDSIKVFLSGSLIVKKSLNQILSDSIIYFTINNSGIATMSPSLGSYSYSVTSVNTGIIEEYSKEKHFNVLFYDILGRTVYPAEGAFIKRTMLGYIVL